jgi:hypothetical protein
MVSLSTSSHTTRSGLGLTRREARKAIHQGEGFPRFSNFVRSPRSVVRSKRWTLLCHGLQTTDYGTAKAIDLEREPERC